MTLTRSNDNKAAKRNDPSSGTDNSSSRWPEFGSPGQRRNKPSLPAANVKESDKEFVVELSVPGYRKKELSVEVDSNRVLHISAEHREESNENKDHYTRREFSHDSFTRSFSLPDTIDEQKIDARYNDGVIAIHLPKKETAAISKTSKKITIS